MAHILPHWNWPERIGQNVPVHVSTTGDGAELFLSGSSLGIRKKCEPHANRLAWGDVIHQPGKLKAVVRRNGIPWARQSP